MTIEATPSATVPTPPKARRTTRRPPPVPLTALQLTLRIPTEMIAAADRQLSYERDANAFGAKLTRTDILVAALRRGLASMANKIPQRFFVSTPLAKRVKRARNTTAPAQKKPGQKKPGQKKKRT